MTSDKIRFMKNFVTVEVILSTMEDFNLNVKEAMKNFYNSEVFNRLEDCETGLYRESGAYVYELYKTEMQHGRLLQTEI